MSGEFGWRTLENLVGCWMLLHLVRWHLYQNANSPILPKYWSTQVGLGVGTHTPREMRGPPCSAL